MFSIQIQKVFFFPSEVWIKDITEQWNALDGKEPLRSSCSNLLAADSDAVL